MPVLVHTDTTKAVKKEAKKARAIEEDLELFAQRINKEVKKKKKKIFKKFGDLWRRLGGMVLSGFRWGKSKVRKEKENGGQDS